MVFCRMNLTSPILAARGWSGTLVEGSSDSHQQPRGGERSMGLTLQDLLHRWKASLIRHHATRSGQPIVAGPGFSRKPYPSSLGLFSFLFFQMSECLEGGCSLLAIAFRLVNPAEGVMRFWIGRIKRCSLCELSDGLAGPSLFLEEQSRLVVGLRQPRVILERFSQIGLSFL